MILGFDHVTLPFVDAALGARLLEPLGYRTAFLERDAPNRPEKSRFLRRYAPSHDLALCRSPHGPAIEVISYGSALGPAGPAACLPVFSDPAAGEPAVDPLLARSGQAVAARAWRLPALGADCLAAAPAAVAANRIVLPSGDLEAAARFWELGLAAKRQESSAPGAATLRLASPVPAWRLEVTLVAGRPDVPAFLDDPGFACPALLTNRIEEDLARAAALATASSGVFELALHGRALRVALLRGPDGALVELVQIVTAGDAPRRDIPGHA